MARPRPGAARKSPRNYRWCGRTFVQDVETTAQTAVGDILQLCPPNSSPESANDYVLERVIMFVGLERILTTAVDACAGVLAIQKVDNSGALTDILEPLNTTATEREFMIANKGILHYELFAVPPTIIDGSTGSRELDRQNTVTKFEYRSRRRISLSRETVTWTMACDVNIVLRQFVVGRALLSY